MRKFSKLSLKSIKISTKYVSNLFEETGNFLSDMYLNLNEKVSIFFTIKTLKLNIQDSLLSFHRKREKDALQQWHIYVYHDNMVLKACYL